VTVIWLGRACRGEAFPDSSSHAAKVRAGSLQDALVAELPPDVVAAAITRGRSRTIEDVVAELL